MSETPATPLLWDATICAARATIMARASGAIRADPSCPADRDAPGRDASDRLVGSRRRT